MSSRALMAAAAVIVTAGWTLLADIVPEVVQQPGTQPGEISALESADKCDNCHGGYDQNVEPALNWRGSMMANAGRDPIFWATLAIAEQDFDGAGDLCIRCHSPTGWTAGRSTPTDGSALAPKDADGVECDLCHTMTNPDQSEHVGVQNAPYIANDEGTPPQGYYGSGMYVLSNAASKLGPYPDAEARHQFAQSQFHRSREFCGTCHDVSNPVVGDLAPNAGTQPLADPVIQSGGAPDVSAKAAFNNFPFQYGIVERTFSEHTASLVDDTPVSSYLTLPPELQAGAFEAGYLSALAAGTGGNFADNTVRYYTCQTCHLRPVVGVGCNKQGAPIRSDLPLHDMTGGNYWMPDAIMYLDQLGLLRLGGGLTATQITALEAGKLRAMKQLNEAASLTVVGNTLRVVNLTGHKLISGYPEGRRMWLNIKWYDGSSGLIREDGAYGNLDVWIDGVLTTVRTLADLHDPNTKIYEAHYAMTQEWAATLTGLGYPPDLPLTFDRTTGAVTGTLGDLAGGSLGAYAETFHFVLNNKVAKDNRIPPYGMDYELARQRNALPVPDTQYGNPAPDGSYNYWDDVSLNVPAGAVYATIDLLYQPTSWEYVQFLYLANGRTNPFLADEGVNLLAAWLNTTMAEPYVMASTTWGTPPTPPAIELRSNSLTTWCVDRRGAFTAECGTFATRETMGYISEIVDTDGAVISAAQVFTEIRDDADNVVTSQQAFTDQSGQATFTWKIPRGQAAGVYTVTVIDVLKSGYEFNPASGVPSVTFTVQ